MTGAKTSAGELREKCDRTETIINRSLNCHWITVLDREQFKATLRIALDTEVEAGGSYLNNGWNCSTPQAGADVVLEQSERLDGTIMQTVRLPNGSEVVREAGADGGVREALKPFADYYDLLERNGYLDGFDLISRQRGNILGHAGIQLSQLKAARAALASSVPATPDMEKIAQKCKADFYALWCDECNCHPMHCALSAQQPVATERRAIIEECARAIDDLKIKHAGKDAGRGYYHNASLDEAIEAIRALVQQPRFEGRS